MGNYSNKDASTIPGMTIQRRAKITLSFTAEDWQLYTENGYGESTAQILNQELERCVNREGFDKLQTRKVMESLLEAHSEQGANDTEPRAFLERLLSEIYF